MGDVIQEVKNKIDIVDIVSEHVALSKKGKNFWGVCPFHEDTNPSMSVSPDKQLFKCFVCGTAGGPIKFLSLIKKESYASALEELANKVGVEFKSRKRVVNYSDKQLNMFRINKEALNFYQYSISTDEGAKALDYSNSRGISQNIIEEFGIGYAPKLGLKEFLLKKGYDEAILLNLSLLNSKGEDFFKDRLIFSIKDDEGNVVGFSARDLSGKAQAKYINSGESEVFKKSNIIYNYNVVKNILNSEKVIYVNEGFMDVIAMTRAGIMNSVAIMGTSLTSLHAKKLAKYEVRMMLDSDKAGINATIKSLKILLENNIKSSVVQNNSGMDPDEILADGGAEKLIEISKNTISGIEYIYQLHKKKYGNEKVENVKAFIESFNKYLSHLDDIEQGFYIKKASIFLGVDPTVFKPVKKIQGVEINSSARYTPPIHEPSENFVHQEVKKSMQIEGKVRHYGYVVILSMIKKAEFRKIYLKAPVPFYDPMVSRIANYIVHATKDHKKPGEDMINKLQEMRSVESPVETVDEFIDAVNLANISYWRYNRDLYYNKAKATDDIKEKEIYYKEATKMVKKLKDYE